MPKKRSKKPDDHIYIKSPVLLVMRSQLDAYERLVDAVYREIKILLDKDPEAGSPDCKKIVRLGGALLRYEIESYKIRNRGKEFRNG